MIVYHAENAITRKALGIVTRTYWPDMLEAPSIKRWEVDLETEKNFRPAVSAKRRPQPKRQL